jgi:ADP-heptose:LPS heptosyltransferase
LEQDDARARLGSQALFQSIAEPLADRFEPRLCDIYAEMFSEVIASALPELKAGELLTRYQRIRRPGRFEDDVNDAVDNVFVLSRVTLGADIAITSQVLDAAKRRFPNALIILVGGQKTRELFAADPRLDLLPVAYRRNGTLRERLGVWRHLRSVLSRPGSIIIDPDSRLTQLGLLPAAPEWNYYFFESRAYGSEGHDTLGELTRRWLDEILGIPDATPYLAPAVDSVLNDTPVIAVSLGVGDNPAKRIPDPFEGHLLRALSRKEVLVLVDKGSGAEEAERVDRAISNSGARRGRVRAWQGPFSDFAAIISRSRLFVGYDSAGGHAAAACGTPMVSIFAGFASPRMFDRWRPTGTGPIEVVRVEEADPREVLCRTLAAIERLGL